MAASKSILLINPWIYDFAAYNFWLKPLGLLQIAGIIERHARCRVDLIDCLASPGSGRGPARDDGRGPFPKEEVPKPSVLRGVPRRYSRYGISVPAFRDALAAVPVPDCVLLTCVMTYWYPGVQAVIELVRERFGGVPVVLGGAYPTLVPDHALAQSGADRIVRGPGENRILPLLGEILGDGVVDEVEFPSLSSLPRPSFDLSADRAWLPLLTSRGCPLRCSFCASRLLAPGFEQRDPAGVVEEIREGAARFGTRHFVFYDDALLVNKARHIVPILEGVLAAGAEVSFHAPNGLHVREIDEDLARLMRRADVRSIYLSQESMDAKLLSERSPKVVPGDLGPAVALLERAGYARGELHVYLIVGLPGQGAAAVRAAVLRVRETGLVPRLAHFSPIPGTGDWQRLVDAGILDGAADPLLHNKTVGPYFWGSLSPEEIAGVRELMVL